MKIFNQTKNLFRRLAIKKRQVQNSIFQEMQKFFYFSQFCMLRAENTHVGIKKHRLLNGMHNISFFVLVLEIVLVVGFCYWNYRCQFATKSFVDICLLKTFIFFATKYVVCFWFCILYMYFIINTTILYICRKMTLAFWKFQIIALGFHFDTTR